LPPFLRYIIVEVVADLKVVYSSSTFTTEAQLRKFADSCPEPPIELVDPPRCPEKVIPTLEAQHIMS